MPPRRSSVAAALLAVLVACGGDDGGSSGGDIEGLEIERIGPYEHVVTNVEYDQPAPSGGNHLFAPYWLNCGVYEGEVPPVLAVHSLEHGAVWIALGPESSQADRQRAAELAEGQKVVVSDVSDLADPVQLVAWGARLPLERLDDARAEQFLDAFIDGPGAPESGSSCGSEFGDPPDPPVLDFG